MAPRTELAGPAIAEAAPSRAAVEAAFFEHYPSLVRAVSRITGSTAEAEEIAVETFIRLNSRQVPLEEYSNLGGWLYRTATRLAIDAVRAAHRSRWYERLAGREAKAPSTPLDGVLRNERVTRVRATLARLKPVHAQMLVLRSHGLSYKELADALRLNAASVGTMLARAEDAFAKEFRQAERRQAQ